MLTTRGQGLLRIILQLRLIGYLHPEVSAFRLSIPSYILNIWKQTLVRRWTEEEYESCIYQAPVTYVRWARYEIPPPDKHLPHCSPGCSQTQIGF